MNILQQINDHPTLSLEHISLIKIAVTLWNQDAIKSLITKLDVSLDDTFERQEKWNEIECRMIERVPLLPQPERFKEKILCFIKPIGLQILKWKEFHNRYIDIGLPKEFCWTPQGTIDEEKTAETLIKDDNLNIKTRYVLASIYCLESNVRELWNSIPVRIKLDIYNRHPSFSKEHCLVVFWTCYIKGEVSKLKRLTNKFYGRRVSFYRFAFECVLCDCNKAAIKWVLQKLTPREREEILASCAIAEASFFARNLLDSPENNASDLFFVLFSQMNEKQQGAVLKESPYEVLICFLEWPWQSSVLKIANLSWGYLSEEDFTCFLEKIIIKVEDGYKDYDYQTLFGEIWQQSPMTFKGYTINVCANGSNLLTTLFEVKDSKNISLILKDATLAKREQIIFSPEGKNICECLAYDYEWDSLKFFINECISSQVKMIKFKEELKKHIGCLPSKTNEDNKNLEEEELICNFFQLLDDLICEFDKNTGMEDGNSSPAKRLYNSIREQ